LERVFEPFFTTKFVGRGLGLPAVLGILRRHRAGLELRSSPATGTTLRMYFPLPEAAPRPESREGRTEVWRGSGVLLLVDDVAAVRGLAATALEWVGFEVAGAAGGAEALAWLEAHPATPRLALIDLTMPGMDGGETFAALRRLRPDLPVLLTSGLGRVSLPEDLLALPGVGFLAKPFTFEQLVTAVRRLLEATPPEG
jgi:CheY-like chemotaxis protein